MFNKEGQIIVRNNLSLLVSVYGVLELEMCRVEAYNDHECIICLDFEPHSEAHMHGNTNNTASKFFSF